MHIECLYANCNSSSRHIGEPFMNDVIFFPFPSPHTQPDKCQKWIDACSIPDCSLSAIGRYSRICSRHFLDGKPTKENPDPMPNKPFGDVSTNSVQKTSELEEKTDELEKADASDFETSGLMISNTISLAGDSSETDLWVEDKQTEVSEPNDDVEESTPIEDESKPPQSTEGKKDGLDEDDDDVICLDDSPADDPLPLLLNMEPEVLLREDSGPIRIPGLDSTPVTAVPRPVRITSVNGVGSSGRPYILAPPLVNRDRIIPISLTAISSKSLIGVPRVAKVNVPPISSRMTSPPALMKKSPSKRRRRSIRPSSDSDSDVTFDVDSATNSHSLRRSHRWTSNHEAVVRQLSGPLQVLARAELREDPSEEKDLLALLRVIRYENLDGYKMLQKLLPLPPDAKVENFKFPPEHDMPSLEDYLQMAFGSGSGEGKRKASDLDDDMEDDD